MPSQLQHPEYPHEPKHLHNLAQVAQLRVTAHGHVHQEGEVEGQHRDNVDQVQWVLEELPGVGGEQEAGSHFKGEPGDAEILQLVQDGFIEHVAILIHLLVLRHAVDTHGGYGNEHHTDGHEAEEFAGDGVAGVLHGEPEAFAHVAAAQRAVAQQVMVDVRDLIGGCVHAADLALLVPVVVPALQLALVVAVAAAGVQEELVDAPVLDLLAEGEDAQLLHDVQLPRLVEVEHVEEEAGVSVKVELPGAHIVVIAELQDGLLWVAGEQASQAGVGELGEGTGAEPPSQTPHVDVDNVLLKTGTPVI